MLLSAKSCYSIHVNVKVNVTVKVSIKVSIMTRVEVKVRGPSLPSQAIIFRSASR